MYEDWIDYGTKENFLKTKEKNTTNFNLKMTFIKISRIENISSKNLYFLGSWSYF